MSIQTLTMPRASTPLTLELTLLGVLERTPMHGYHLFKAVSDLDGFGLIWKLKQSHLYALLDKLEAKGLIQGRAIAGEAHPSRREFRLTAEGLRALDAWVAGPVDSIRSMRQDFFARLHFARLRGEDGHLMRLQREACLEWRESVVRKLGQDCGDYTRVVLGHRLHIIDATLAWMDDYERNRK